VELDPRVTLAALAHPGLNSVAATRLVGATFTRYNCQDDATTHNPARRSCSGSFRVPYLRRWLGYRVRATRFVRLDVSCRAVRNTLLVGVAQQIVGPERR